jgi:hypothetical protein
MQMTSPGRFLRSFVPALCVVASAGAARAVDVDVAVVPPGCADPWQRVLTLAATLAEPIGRRGGSFVVTASAPDARAAADVVVFPEADDAGVTRPVAAIPADLVADGDIDVLETPFERIVVVDPLDGVDLLGLIADAARTSGGRFPDVVRRRLPQLRGPGVRALITGEAHAAEHPPGSDRREVAARFDVRVGDDHGVVVAIARSLGGPARLQRALAGRAPGLVLSAGGSRDPACDAALVALGVAAAVPRTVDLARAPLSTSLPESSGARSALPFLAANVVGVDGTRPFPRHRVFDVAGVRVAVIGLVGTGELLRAPASTRAHLRATSGRDAVADVIGGLRRDPAGPPDLIVALSSGDGAERAQLSAVDGLDVVIADFARDDGLAMDVDVVPRAREQSRHDAVFAPVLHRAGLGRITAVFDDAAPAAGMPRALQRLRVAVDPLLDDGQTTAASAALAAPLRALEDERALGGADVLLPAVAKIAALPAAAPLVWGERIAMLGEERRRVPGDAALWTDDLWLRVVGNAVARGVDADVALVRNMRRAPLVAGPLTRATAQAWLVDTGSAVVVDVGGADLLRLADRIASTPPLVDDASGLMSVSGLDPARRVVGGRPIEPLATYRVVVDERLLADARLTGVIDDAHASDRPALAPLVTRALGVGDVDPASLVVDRATERRAEWRLGIPAFELRGSVVRTSPNLLRLAPSLETRAAQRELVAAAAKLLAFATWDAPGFTWDNQLRVQYDATFFADATRGPPVIEPFDDVVGTTELRRDIARFGAAADAPVLVGFVGVTGDGELTPVPLLRRQAQLRQAAGLAWSTTGWLREARLGAVAQQDLADLFTAGDADHVYVDAGVLGLVRFAGPLAGAVALESTTDARFFLPDGDDRPFDLALRAQSVTRVAAPLSASTNGFVFVDVVALSAKPQPATIEWNIVSGVGIAFGGVLRR